MQVINDFAALALAVPSLRPSEVRQVGAGTPVPTAAIAVIGPGTGLGVSGLAPASSGWSVLQGEGGHTTFSPATRREIQVLGWLLDRYPHVSTERVASGMGLENLYQALCALDGVRETSLSAEQISAAALAGNDTQCREALGMFCGILGTAAGNLALTLGARGGCFIGGGIVPKLGEYFDRSTFRSRFESKGRTSDYICAIPTYVILAENPALRGLATLFADA